MMPIFRALHAKGALPTPEPPPQRTESGLLGWHASCFPGRVR
jgi:hypothetical protein